MQSGALTPNTWEFLKTVLGHPKPTFHELNSDKSGKSSINRRDTENMDLIMYWEYGHVHCPIKVSDT